MNSEHLQLREDPFGASADPKFLYEAESHSQAAAALITNLDSGVRLQVLVSSPGVGKSTLLYCLEECASRNANTVFIENPRLEAAEFLSTVIDGVGGELPVDTNEPLNAAIVSLLNSPVRNVLIIDDAQHLDESILEAVNVLIEDTLRKLQVVMAGDIDLPKRLKRTPFLSLRMARTIELRPIQLRETSGYISHRLCAAGYDGPSVFDDDAVRMIHQHSGGVPLLINEFCSEALACATSLQSERVDRTLMAQVLPQTVESATESDCFPVGDPRPEAIRAEPERIQPQPISSSEDFAELLESWLVTHARMWVGTAGELAAQLRNYADPGSRLRQTLTSVSITGMIEESADCLRMMGVEAKLSSANSLPRLISLRFSSGSLEDSAHEKLAEESPPNAQQHSRSSEEKNSRCLGRTQASMSLTDPVFTAEELAAVEDLLSRYLESVPDNATPDQSPQVETKKTQDQAESPTPTPAQRAELTHHSPVRSRREPPRSAPVTLQTSQSVTHVPPVMTRSYQVVTPISQSSYAPRQPVAALGESRGKLVAVPVVTPAQQGRLMMVGVLGGVTIAGILFMVGFLAVSFNSLSTSGSTDTVQYSLPAEGNSRDLHQVAPSELVSLAKSGDSGAQYELGRRYSNGIGTRRDNKQALKWLRKSAEWGHPEAQFQLARMLADTGELSEAYTWLVLAATNGEPKAKDESNLLAAKLSGPQLADARFRTGQRFADGLGVSRDYPTAYAWFRLANAAGSQEALERMATLKLRLKSNDMDEVQRQYSAWLVTQLR